MYFSLGKKQVKKKYSILSNFFQTIVYILFMFYIKFHIIAIRKKKKKNLCFVRMSKKKKIGI